MLKNKLKEKKKKFGILRSQESVKLNSLRLSINYKQKKSKFNSSRGKKLFNLLHKNHLHESKLPNKKYYLRQCRSFGEGNK